MSVDSDVLAYSIFNRLGRKAKFALHRRDPHTMREHLGAYPDGLDHATRAALLAACDKYVVSLRRKGVVDGCLR